MQRESMARPTDPNTPIHGRILLVEDEADLQELLRYNFSREGYEVVSAVTGEQAIDLAQRHEPDVILLDLMLPRMDGLEVCRRLKADDSTSSIPIIMVTAKGEEADVVTGLELGADDYVAKPFSPRVLIARVKAVLRRVGGSDETMSTDGRIRHGSLELSPDRHEASLEGEALDLTATEFRLLALLARRPGRVFTRHQIISALHGGHTIVTDRSVDVQVVSLRRKLGEHAEMIETIRGVGYRFRDERGS
jgi:two-component system phosphate regulon response regulator PhoB